MTIEQAEIQAKEKSLVEKDVKFYVFYNDAIPNLHWYNRYECKEWEDRPNNRYKIVYLNGLKLDEELPEWKKN